MDGSRPMDFGEWRARRAERVQEAETEMARQAAEELRPDLREPRDDGPLESRRLPQRLYALAHLGEALRAALQGALQVSVAVAYEQLYRTRHPESGTDRILEPVRDVVALEQVPNVAVIAAA